jgi:4-hydroxy-2-oxoheptanedioate aldolase
MLRRGVLNIIPSAVVTQAIAAAGADFVLIDCEHGSIGPETLHAMIAATAGTSCAPLVRVPSIDEAPVKAALDAGAMGIVYPLVRTASDAERCVSYVRYPPDGVRGWGPFVAHSRWGVPVGEYLSRVGPSIECIVLIETAEAVENIESIVAVPGIDAAVIAQFDLSTALGVHGDFEAQEFKDAVQRIERAVLSRGLPLGGSALTRDATRAMVDRGYTFLFHGFDLLMLKAGVESFRDWA